MIAGRIRYGNASTKFVPGGIDDCDGSHLSSMAKMAMRISPLTNSGRPMNAREPTEIVWSTQVFLRNAARRPRKMPSGTYIAKATAASISELRRRWNTIGRTGPFMLGESPQSPRT